MEAPNTTIAVQRYLDEVAQTATPPSDEAIRQILARSVNRLRCLCGRVLCQNYPRLTGTPEYLEADDVLAAVVDRLIRSLREVKPESVQHFFRLASRHIRWELAELARRIDQQGAILPLTCDPAAPAAATTAADTPTLLRILTAIESLPDEEREVFELVRIQGVTHAEAASMLEISEKTVQRRLRRGVMLLSASLGDLLPQGAAEDGTEPPTLAADPPGDRV